MAVILETSLGDITVDLYTKERPRCEFSGCAGLDLSDNTRLNIISLNMGYHCRYWNGRERWNCVIADIDRLALVYSS